MYFESVGRFSIGCSDALCLIFFVTIPLLHSGCKSEEEQLEINENDKQKEEQNNENMVIENLKEDKQEKVEEF